MHRIDKGEFIEDPLKIHARQDTLVRSKTNPEKIKERLNTDFVFTFVREPLARAYSCFNEKIVHVGPYSIKKGRNALETYGADFKSVSDPETHRKNFKLFLKFVRNAVAGEALWDPHWMPQTLLLRRSVYPHRIPNFFGKVENLNKEMGFVLSFVGSDFDMSTCPRMNEGPPPPFKLREIVDDEIIETAKAIYKSDLRAFGYSL